MTYDSVRPPAQFFSFFGDALPNSTNANGIDAVGGVRTRPSELKQQIRYGKPSATFSNNDAAVIIGFYRTQLQSGNLDFVHTKNMQMHTSAIGVR